MCFRYPCRAELYCRNVHMHIKPYRQCCSSSTHGWETHIMMVWIKSTWVVDSLPLWKVLLMVTIVNTCDYEEYMKNNGTPKVTANVNQVIRRKVVWPKLDQLDWFCCPSRRYWWKCHPAHGIRNSKTHQQGRANYDMCKTTEDTSFQNSYAHM